MQIPRADFVLVYWLPEIRACFEGKQKQRLGSFTAPIDMITAQDQVLSIEMLLMSGILGSEISCSSVKFSTLSEQERVCLGPTRDTPVHNQFADNLMTIWPLEEIRSSEIHLDRMTQETSSSFGRVSVRIFHQIARGHSAVQVQGQYLPFSAF
jgi:hypothetical protein